MGEIVIKQEDIHSTPSSGKQSLYPKTDDLWYTKRDDGSEVPLFGGGDVTKV